jgi:hypothetical protein
MSSSAIFRCLMPPVCPIVNQVRAAQREEPQSHSQVTRTSLLRQVRAQLHRKQGEANNPEWLIVRVGAGVTEPLGLESTHLLTLASLLCCAVDWWQGVCGELDTSCTPIVPLVRADDGL